METNPSVQQMMIHAAEARIAAERCYEYAPPDCAVQAIALVKAARDYQNSLDESVSNQYDAHSAYGNNRNKPDSEHDLAEARANELAESPAVVHTIAALKAMRNAQPT